MLRLETSEWLGEDGYAPRRKRPKSKIGVFGPLVADVSNFENDELNAFRNIHVEMKVPINSLTEAEEILKQDKCDPHALKYLGWHLLQSQNQTIGSTRAAIDYLEQSISYGT